MGERLKECVGGLAKCSPNLITLAEKLGFNVERFSKITSPIKT
jgi:hypothetical protein